MRYILNMWMVIRMSVTFKNNTMNVKKALNEKAIAYLYEASGELLHEVQANTRVDTGQLKGSWRYEVNESDLESVIGSPLENAIWEEFGTGEYAVGGNGRKGGWFYVDAKGKGHFTRGKKPQHGFKNAFDSIKDALIRRAESILGEMGEE